MRFESSPEERKKESPEAKLSQAIRSYAASINELFRDHLEPGNRAGDILDGQCRIDMRSFMSKRDGPYQKEGNQGILEDEELVRTHELVFSGALDETFCRNRYQTTDQDEVLRRWNESESHRDGALGEAAILCLLNKFLAGRFVAVRASKYDDYEHGVDMLILDRESGGVVCAVDEVVGVMGDERYQKKVARAKEKLSNRGGMEVKYGLSFGRNENGLSRIERKRLPKVPGFCASISHESLRQLMWEADFVNQEKTADIERSVLASIVASLRNQESKMKEGMTEEQQSHVEILLSHLESVL